MTKNKKVVYRIEGPDWDTEVEVDSEIYETEKSQLFEAGTQAIEKMMSQRDELNIGAVLLIRKKRSHKEAIVNAFICLNNAAQYEVANALKENFKKQSGQDLSLDENGYSY